MKSPAEIVARLTAPLSIEGFFDCYKNRRAVHVKAERRRDLALDVTLESFFAAVSSEAGSPSQNVKVQYFTADEEHRVFALPPGARTIARDLLDAGMTLCISGYDRLSAPVARIASALGAVFGVPGAVAVACYVSGPGRGFGLHFDGVPVLVLQCEGQKRWRFGREPSTGGGGGEVIASDHRAVASYVRQVHKRLDIPDERDLCEATLSTDDLLFLPAGTWHRAYAEDFSVALTFTLSPARFDQLLVQALVSHAMRQLPSAFEGASPQREDDVESWIASRLPIVLDTLARVRPSQLLPLFESAQPTPPNPGLVDDSATAPWSSASAFRATSRAELALFTAPDQSGRKLFLYRADRGIELPIEFADSLESLFQQGAFSFDQMMSALRTAKLSSDVELHEIVDALVDIGAIAPSRPD